MSGKCTGWVGDNGPHPDDIDRTGRPYGNRARGLRMVLLAVADCANVDGEHAHPGIAGVVRFSLYSSGQARRLLDELEAEGWLVVTEQGGGRAAGSRHGRATVYRVPMGADHPMLVKRASRAGTNPANARVGAPDTRAPQADTRAPEAVTRASGCAPNGSSNGPSNGTSNGPPADADGRAVAQRVWDASDPKPATPFIGIVKIAARLLAAGHQPDAIVTAMLAVPTISVGWVEAEIREPRRSRGPGRPAAPVDVDRAAPSGEVQL